MAINKNTELFDNISSLKEKTSQLIGKFTFNKEKVEKSNKIIGLEINLPEISKENLNEMAEEMVKIEEEYKEKIKEVPPTQDIIEIIKEKRVNTNKNDNSKIDLEKLKELMNIFGIVPEEINPSDNTSFNSIAIGIQKGSFNNDIIKQNGLFNYVSKYQEDLSNDSEITQSGDFNSTTSYQHGDNNNVCIDQTWIGNQICINQLGKINNSSIKQKGVINNKIETQVGNKNVSYSSQNGVFNSNYEVLHGDINNSFVNELGFLNLSLLTSDGDNNLAISDQEGVLQIEKIDQ